MPINDRKYLGSVSDVRQCLQVGAFVGSLFALRAALGATRSLAGTGQSDGNPWLVGAVVFIGGCLAGALIGAVRPLARQLPVAVLLGFIGTFPVLLLLDVIRSRASYPAGPIRWISDTISALIIGGLGAIVVRRTRPRREQPSTS